MTRLRDLTACFEGVIPSVLATVDAEGMPNISYLSHVHRIDDGRVALSNQFFSKTVENVRHTGGATLMVVDGHSGEQHLLDLAWEGAQDSGELFDRMAAHLRAMSAPQGMAEVMRLRSADIYRVRDLRPVPSPGALPCDEAGPAPPPDRLAAAARLALALAAAPDADAMLDRALEGLAEGFGFAHAMVLLADEAGGRLTTLASRGYERLGIGSEVALGDGVIGIAAASRLPLRIADLSRGQRYAAAVRTGLLVEEREIPLPGLPDPMSQLAVPMVSRGRLVGVIFVESPERYRFQQEDEDALTLVAGQLAAGLRLPETEEREEAAPEPGAASVSAAPLRLRFFDFDGSVFLDGEYLIKGVPGRLLHHLLGIFAATGRRDFTNREIRLDPALRLPDVKDNLEARLILLRRRLEERAAPLRLVSPARGRIRLELSGPPEIEVVSGR